LELSIIVDVDVDLCLCCIINTPIMGKNFYSE
jgi:hypothetical protein